MYVCMYVCMSACNGFTIETYVLRIVYVPLCYVAHLMPSRMEIEVEDWEDRRQCQNKSRCIHEMLNKKKKDNVDKKQLARQHPSDLLRSLTHE